MKTIFLSHSTKDEILAKSIYTLITQFIESSERLAGQYEVFYSPYSLQQFEHGSDNWKNGIYKAMQDCECCIFLLTPNSVENRWFNYEMGLATAADKKIIPIGPHGLNFQLVIRNEIQLLELSNYAGIVRILQRIFNDYLNLRVHPNSWAAKPDNKVLIEEVIYHAHVKTIYFVGSLPVDIEPSKAHLVKNYITNFANKLLENGYHLASYPSVPYIGETVAKCALNRGCEFYEIAGLYKFDDMTDNALNGLNINDDTLNKLLTSLREAYLEGKDCMVIVGGSDNTKHEYDVAIRKKNLQIFPIPCFGGFAKELFDNLKTTKTYRSFDHPCMYCSDNNIDGVCPHMQEFITRFQEYKKIIQ